MIKHYRTLSILLSTAVIFACSDPAEKKADDSATAEAEVESKEEKSPMMPSESSFKFDLIIANSIAAPVKLLTDMNNAGLTHYQEDVTNSTDNIANYVTANDKALAFGVYGADLSYKSLYNRNQEMADYIIAIRKLSEELGLTFLFDQDALEHFEQIKTNPDSVKFFIFDKYDSADDYLRSNERLMTATLILTGGLIESLHLVSSQIETGDASKDAYMIFLGQKNTLKSMLELYNSMEADGQTVPYKEDIRMLYEKFVEVDSFEMFSKDNIGQLHVVIAEVRTKVVGA